MSSVKVNKMKVWIILYYTRNILKRKKKWVKVKECWFYQNSPNQLKIPTKITFCWFNKHILAQYNRGSIIYPFSTPHCNWNPVGSHKETKQPWILRLEKPNTLFYSLWKKKQLGTRAICGMLLPQIISGWGKIGGCPPPLKT